MAEGLCRCYRRRDSFGRSNEHVRVVDGVSLQIERKQSLGIAGRSGSGKSTLARLLLALEEPDEGVVRFDGTIISGVPEKQVRPLRRRFQAVLQDPTTSLDPCLHVGTIVAEPLVAHSMGGADDRRRRVAEVLRHVGLDADAANHHPAAFSGGERQRIAIARALAPEPELLILDEPVSSLDVSVQAQVLDLLVDLRVRHGLAMVLISHDLDVLKDVCDDIAVMSRGTFVESGPTARIISNPDHPQTRELLDAAASMSCE